MSQQTLPDRPHLEHLKKQAKDHLTRLRSTDATATLAEAQLAVARQYGLPSWRALHAEVERRRSAYDLDAAAGEAIRASQVGDLNRLQDLHRQHPTVINHPYGPRGLVPLHEAAYHGHPTLVEWLLGNGADPLYRCIGDRAYALHFAAEKGHIDIVRMLLDAGCDVNIEGDEHGAKVIGWATIFHETQHAMVEYLLERGAVHTIFSAVAIDDGASVTDMVTADPSLLMARLTHHDQEKTPLHLAAVKNLPNMAKLLLELGADPQAGDSEKTTALGRAAQCGNKAVVDVLRSVTRGDELLIAIFDGDDDAVEALLSTDPELRSIGGKLDDLLCDACMFSDLEHVERLLRYGAHPGALVDYRAPLHMAASNGQLDIIEHLLSAGADPTIRDPQHDATPAGWAHHFGKPQAHKRLLQAEQAYSDHTAP